MNGKGSAFASSEVTNGKADCAFRRSYIPSWMEEPSWIPAVEIPQDYILELSSNGASESEYHSFMRCTDRRARCSFSSVALQIEGNGTNPHEQLMTLLGDTIKSITLTAPWDPHDCSKDLRKVMLSLLLRKFIDQSQDPGAIGLFAKDVLQRAAHDDVGHELQYLYVSFLCISHESMDCYRRAQNFKKPEHHEAFQQQCGEEAQRRLQMLNSDMQNCEMTVGRALNTWNNIHGDNRGACFGGSVTLCLASVRLRGPRLPKRIGAVWSLQVDGRVVCRGTVPQRCFMLDNGEYRWSSNGGSVTLNVPVGACKKFESYNIVLGLTEIQQGISCSCTSKEKHIATATVTVDDALYRSIAVPDSQLRVGQRTPRCNEPYSESDSVKLYHFSSLLMVSNDLESKGSGMRIEAAKVFCMMNCLDEEHNSRPPAISVSGSVTDRHVNAPDNTKSDVWARDHHADFLHLVEIMGDIDDASTLILNAYCRRYLIHGELERVALLVSVCTRGSMTDSYSREFCKDALETLIEISDTVTTNTSHQLITMALEDMNTKVLDILLRLEDAIEDPCQSETLLKDMRHFMSIILKTSNIDEYISTEMTKAVQPVMNSLEKLDKLLLCENRSSKLRTTQSDVRLPKLECMEDSARLIAKGRFLRELIDQVSDRLKRAFIFAENSKSALVRNLAQSRIDCSLCALSGPLRNVVARILACLVRSPEPDPLGDTLGLLVCTYSAVKELVGVIDVNPQMHTRCEELCGSFASFLSCWFPLCEDHISTWTESIVTGEALVAIVPGEIHFNQAPGLVLDLLNALLSVFARLLSWTDPDQHDMYLVHFFCLLRRLGEGLADALVAQGRAATQLEEWFVCLSSIRRCQQVLRTFNEEQVQSQLLDVFGDPDLTRKHQRKLISEQMRSTMLETEEELLCHIRQGVERSFMSFLSCLVEAPLSGVVLINSEEIKRLEGRLAEYVRDQVRLAAGCLSTELFNVYFEEIAVKAFHSALQNFMVQYSSKPLTQSDVALMLQLLKANDEQLEEEGGWRAQSEDFTFRQRNRRVLAALLSESTQRLIQMWSDESLCGPEKGLLLLVLRTRKDGEAKKFFRMNRNV